jgi:hypothetical protein
MITHSSEVPAARARAPQINPQKKTALVAKFASERGGELPDFD